MTGAARGTAAGERMVADLLAMHRPLRADLAMLDKALGLLADAVTEPIAEMVNGMTIADFTWQLRVNCDTHCNHLTIHHMVEDERMFPTIGRRFTNLLPDLARLKKQHKEIGPLVNAVQRASLNLTPDPAAVERASVAIGALAEHVRVHLDDEESVMFPAFRMMDRDWHYG